MTDLAVWWLLPTVTRHSCAGLLLELLRRSSEDEAFSKEGVFDVVFRYAPEPLPAHGVESVPSLLDILRWCDDPSEAEGIIRSNPRTNSYVYIVGSGSNGGLAFVTNSYEVDSYYPGDADASVPQLQDTLHAGHYQDKMDELLAEKHGSISIDWLKSDFIPAIAMSSNLQSVIYDLEGRRERLVEHVHLVDADLDLSGGQLGVHVFAAADHFAADGDNVLLAQGPGELRGLGVGVDVESALREASAVAEIDEHQVITVVAVVVDPSGEDNGLPDVGRS